MSTDRETTHRVRLWLEAGVTELPDRVLDTVLDQVPTTKQRRPFWPVRRDGSMNSYLRLGGLVAAVIVLAVAGTALIVGGGIGGDPTDAPSPPSSNGVFAETPGATAPAATSAALLPGEFTACVPGNSEFKVGTDTQDIVSGADGDMTIDRRRGFTWRGAITATDARFSGMHYYSWDGDTYTLASGDPGQSAWAEGHRIENDEGAWHGSTVGISLPDGSVQAGPAVLTGERAYDGLTAVLFPTGSLGCFVAFRGIVTEIPDPPVPYTGN